MILLNRNITISLLFGFTVPFYFIKIASFSNFEYFIIIHRVTFADKFFDGAITNSLEIDSILIILSSSALLFFNLKKKKYIILCLIITGISLIILLHNYNEDYLDITSLLWFPLASTILFVYRKNSDKFFSFKFLLQKAAISCLGLILFIEISSIVVWIIAPILLEEAYSKAVHWHFANLESQIFYMMGVYSPHIVILIIFSFLIIIIQKGFSKEFNYIVNRLNLKFLFDDNTDSHLSTVFQKSFRKIPLFLIFALILGTVFFIYPYLPSFNPSGTPLGTDIHSYVEWMSETKGSELDETINNAFTSVANGNRPLSILFLLLISFITSIFNVSTVETLKFLPLILSPLLILSVYYFVKNISNDKYLAGFSSFITSFSYPITIGIYAAFYSNWLALIIVFITWSLLAKFWKTQRASTYILLFIFTIVILFIHSFTWTFLMAFLFIFTIISFLTLKKDHKLKSLIIFIIILIGINLLVDFSKTLPFGNPTSFEQNIVTPNLTLSLVEFAERWQNLDTAFKIYLGGLLTNSVMLIMTLVWILFSKPSNTLDRILLSSIFVAAIPLLFGNYVVQSRMLYDIPLYLPAAILLYRIGSKKGLISNLFTITIIIHLGNYVLRAFANFYFISPV